MSVHKFSKGQRILVRTVVTSRAVFTLLGCEDRTKKGFEDLKGTLTNEFQNSVFVFLLRKIEKMPERDGEEMFYHLVYALLCGIKNKTCIVSLEDIFSGIMPLVLPQHGLPEIVPHDLQELRRDEAFLISTSLSSLSLRENPASQLGYRVRIACICKPGDIGAIENYFVSVATHNGPIKV